MTIPNNDYVSHDITRWEALLFRETDLFWWFISFTCRWIMLRYEWMVRYNGYVLKSNVFWPQFSLLLFALYFFGVYNACVSAVACIPQENLNLIVSGTILFVYYMNGSWQIQNALPSQLIKIIRLLFQSFWVPFAHTKWYI